MLGGFSLRGWQQGHWLIAEPGHRPVAIWTPAYIWHYRVNICVSPQFMYWNLIPYMRVFRGAAFWRWLGHEGGSLKNGISAFIKETPASSLSLPSVWEHSIKWSATQKRFLTETWPNWHPDHRLPTFRTVRNTFMLLCKPCSPWLSVITD